MCGGVQPEAGTSDGVARAQRAAVEVNAGLIDDVVGAAGDDAGTTTTRLHLGHSENVAALDRDGRKREPDDVVVREDAGRCRVGRGEWPGGADQFERAQRPASAGAKEAKLDLLGARRLADPAKRDVCDRAIHCHRPGEVNVCERTRGNCATGLPDEISRGRLRGERRRGECKQHEQSESVASGH